MNTVKKFRKKDRTGNHTFRVDGKRIRATPGMVVECTAKDLGNQLKHYVCLDVPVKTDEPEVPKVLAKGLKLVRVSRGMYNVVNPDNPDKPLNDAPLRKAMAESFTRAYMDVNEGIKDLNWDDLVALMEERGIEVLDTYETEDDLRQALINATE